MSCPEQKKGKPMKTQIELAAIGCEKGCQTMVEGPIPADVGAAYEHITAAIGAASSARHGANLICCITPAEHLALPTEADVREGVRVTGLAVHIVDLSKHPCGLDLN